MDVQIVLAGRGVKRADFVVLVAQGGAVGRVVGDVADPGDVRGLADEVFGAGGLAKCGEIVVLSGIGGLLFVLHALDGGGFEAAEDVGDRLVDGGDAGNGDRAGDGTHGIGGVALVFGLPELVLTPPTQQVVVDDGYERHGLGVFAHEHREPSHVGRDHLEFGGLRVGQCELFERGGRVGENVVVGQQASGSCLFSRNAISGEQLGGEFAGVRVVHTGFDALQQMLEAVGVSRVDPREGEFGEALRPLKVGHGGQVAEVRLGGLVQGFDDFLAAGVELFGVLHDAHEQTAAFGGVVLELVNVGVQVAQAGGHATDGLAGRHPVGGLRGEHVVGLGVGRNTGRLDEQLLDFGAGVSLLGGHRGGTDKHAVDRHVGQAVGVGPLAGNVVGRAFGGADAAAGDQHEVVAGAHFGVGGGKQVVQRFPAVVAAGFTALDLNHDGGGGHGLGDAHDLANLVHGAGLETHVRQTVRLQRLDQGHGFVQLGDAGGDDHAVDRRAGSTLLGHDAGGAELQVPQVTVHEHRVEFDRAAFLQLVFEGGDVAVEHFGGHLAAAGELGPVAGVGRGGHDFRFHGGGGHAGQQYRRLAGELGELGDQLGAGRGVDDARGECLPVLGALRLAFQRGERGALGQRGGFDHADAGALHHIADQLAERVAGAEVHDPQL